ncbi:hypothetical protein ACVWZA_003977 [Sphingomonas sp. UYAg733]
MTPDTENQLATLIDLTGTVPLIAPLRECTRHFAALKVEHRADARILLTQPVARAGQKTRTWLLEPAEIAALVTHFGGADGVTR